MENAKGTSSSRVDTHKTTESPSCNQFAASAAGLSRRRVAPALLELVASLMAARMPEEPGAERDKAKTSTTSFISVGYRGVTRLQMLSALSSGRTEVSLFPYLRCAPPCPPSDYADLARLHRAWVSKEPAQKTLHNHLRAGKSFLAPFIVHTGSTRYHMMMRNTGEVT